MFFADMRIVNIIAFAMLAYSPVMTLSCNADLVSHYDADGDATDSMSGNDGTLNNGAGFATGRIGQAFDFDGTNDFVQVSDDPSLDIFTTITLTAWIRPESGGSTDGSTGILWKGNNVGAFAGQSYALFFTDFGVSFRLGEGSTLFQTPAAAVPLNTFSHIAATFDGSQMKLYVNGTLEGIQNMVPTSINNSTGDLLIGSSTESAAGMGGDPTRFFFDGQIDDVRIYDHALTQAEVRALSVPEPSVCGLFGMLALGIGVFRRTRTPAAGSA